MADNPKLASVTLFPREVPGGMQVVAQWLNEVARKAGFEIEEVSSPLAGWQKKSLPYTLAGDIWQFAKITREVRRRRGAFDGYIVHSPAAVCPGPGLTLFHLNIHDYIERAYPWWNMKQWRLRLVSKRLDMMSALGERINIAISRSQADGLRSLDIRVDEVIYNPVDTELFHPSSNREALRNVLGWPQDRLVILSVGRFARGKGLERVLRLAERHSEIEFRFVGFSNDALGVHPTNCAAMGHIPREEIAPYYQAADALIFVPVAEGFGNVLMEAMACGLPYMATPTGLGADLFSEGEILSSGITSIEDHDDERILKLLVESPSLRREMGEAARTFAIEHSAEPMIAARYTELLRSVLK